MDAALQRKEGDPSSKTVRASTPEAANPAAPVEAAVGLPLFLGGGLCGAASRPAPIPVTPLALQREAQTEDEAVLQAKCCTGAEGPAAREDDEPLQRQAVDEEDGEEVIQAAPAVQAKLVVGPADDAYERQADQVAATVMRLPASAPAPLQRRPLDTLQRRCARCEDELEPAGQAAPIQTKPEPNGPAGDSAMLERTVKHPGSGAPLAPDLQTRIGAVLGRDLSGVRVYADEQAQTAAQGINAKAFTHGNHIFLGHGQRDTDVGLMAHEATHVAQQGAAPAIAPGPEASEPVSETSPGEGGIDAEGASMDEAQDGSVPIPTGMAEPAPLPEAPATSATAEEAMAAASASPDAEAADILAPEVRTATLGGPAAEPQTGVRSSHAAGAQAAPGGAAEPVPATAEGDASPVPAGEEAEGEVPAEAAAETQHAAPGAAGDAGGESGGGGAAGDRTEGDAAEAEAEQAGPEAEGGGAAAADVDPEARLAAAPASAHKAFVLAQAERIHADCDSSAGLVQALAAARRAEVSGRFAGVRAGLSGFIESRIDAVQGFVADKQARIGAVIANALATVTGAVSGALTTVQHMAAAVQASISGLVQRAVGSVQSAIAGIVGRIGNLINSLPLPDLPGVAQARRLASGLLNRAVASVNAALGRVLGMIQGALAIGMGLLSRALASVQALITLVLTRISAALNRITAAVFSLFNRILSRVVGTLRRILYGTILPILARAERRVLHAITEQAQRALARIRANCRQQLTALAEALSGAAEPNGQAETTGSEREWRASVTQITQTARDNNAAIIQSFLDKTGGFLALLLTTLQSVATQIMAAVTARIARFITAAVDYAAKVVQTLRGMVAAVTQFIANTITRAIALFARVVNYVRDLVERPVQRLIEFAESVLSRIRGAIGRLVRRVVSGEVPGFDLGELIGRFRLPPLSNNPTIAFAGPPSGFVIVIIQGVVYIVAFGFAFSLTVAEFIVLIIVIVVILIVILILLYLLYRWLTRPRPIPKPRPRPRPRGREFHPDTPFNVISSVPLRKVKLPASSGDEVVFGVRSTDKDRFRPIGTAAWIPIDPGTGPYETVYEVSGHASWLAPGSGNTRHVDPTLNSQDIRLYIDEDWNGAPITVTATVRDQAPPVMPPPDTGTTRDPVHVITWTLDLCQDPLTTATAKHIPGLAPQLNHTDYNSTSLTLLDGSSDTVGASMLTEYLTHEKGGGGRPSGQDNLYGFRRLPTRSAHGGSGYQQTQVYIKGHLLNHSDSRGLGGVGDPINLYPITGQANSDHNSQVEENVKDLVHEDKLVVMYSVNVVNQDGPHAIDIFGDGHCTYQYINAAFSCAYATYKYCDGKLEMNTPENGGGPVASSFDLSGFIENIRDNKGSCQES